MREKYYTSKEIGKFLQKSDRWVRQLAEKEFWDFKSSKKNGAMEKRFPLSLLPAYVQEEILSAQTMDLEPLEDTPMNRLTLAPYNRRKAEARLTAIEMFRQFHTEHGGKKIITMERFVENWEQIASPQTLEVLPKLSVPTLYRWDEKLTKGGVTSLAPKFGNRQGVTKLPTKYHDLVLNAYLSQNQRSASSIHSHIINQIALHEVGDDDLGLLAEKKRELKKELSDYVVLNFIKNNTTKGLRTLARGNERAQDRILSHVTRERESLISNQIWVSDGHDANTFVIAENGKPVRPVIVAWMDERSRMIMGWSVDITENTDLIIDSLCVAVENHGIPQEVYIDNGKAYVNKRTTAEEKAINEKRFTTYQMLGCKVRKSRPYNGREKSIERFWGTLDGAFAKYLRGYAGKDILSKPKQTELEIKNHSLLSLDEYKMFLTEFVKKYNTDVHHGESMKGLSPYEVYQASLDSQSVRYADKELLAQARLVYLNDLRVIGAGGRIRARNINYVAPEFIAHIGEKVKVGLDPRNLDRAYIFLNDRLLCIAENEIKADYDPNSPKTQKAFRQQAKSKSAVKKLKKKITEIKKTESASLLTENTKMLESKNIEIIPTEKEEVFDLYDY